MTDPDLIDDEATVLADPAVSEDVAANKWFEDEVEEDAEATFKEYDITASPNDFNVKTIVDFVSSGAVKIPGFQRNYVWDRQRASKLIESLLIGLPIPQIFLYEDTRNSFLVIDGQQRLMSIYYFAKGRFPRREKRPALRKILDQTNVLPDSILADDEYFQKFNLSLVRKDGQPTSQFNGKNFDTLADYKTTLEMRTIRNVVIKQTAPKDDSSIFEIFNRLNTGGVNLRPQEIRSSLYHSPFTRMLHRVNVNPTWRLLIGLDSPDLHEKDVEILLRVIGLVIDGDSYAEPMSAFLNSTARKARQLTEAQLAYLERLFEAFFVKATVLKPSDLTTVGSGRFNIGVFEALFRAACSDAFASTSLEVKDFSSAALAELKRDPLFMDAIRFGIGRTAFVRQRYDRARAALDGVRPSDG